MSYRTHDVDALTCCLLFRLFFCLSGIWAVLQLKGWVTFKKGINGVAAKQWSCCKALTRQVVRY